MASLAAAESDRLLERLLTMPPVSYYGWRAKAVALLRHLENQRPTWPSKYPNREIARRALVPLLEEVIIVGIP